MRRQSWYGRWALTMSEPCWSRRVHPAQWPCAASLCVRKECRKRLPARTHFLRRKKAKLVGSPDEMKAKTDIALYHSRQPNRNPPFAHTLKGHSDTDLRKPVSLNIFTLRSTTRFWVSRCAYYYYQAIRSLDEMCVLCRTLLQTHNNGSSCRINNNYSL